MAYNDIMTNIVINEMQSHCYEKAYPVQINDRILDLGCSKGFFYQLHKDKLSYYLGVDGDILAIKEFIDATKTDPKPQILNALIGETKTIINSPSWWFPELNKNNAVLSVTFPQLLEYVGIVDFLKIDIEGFETEVFKDLDLFKNNIRRFGAEFHLKRPGVMDILHSLKNDKYITFKLYSVDLVDITDYFWNNSDYYSEILINGKVNINQVVDSYSTTSKRQNILKVNINFTDGAYINVNSEDPSKEYIAKFYNYVSGEEIYSCSIGNYRWAKTIPRYFLPYHVKLIEKDLNVVVWEHRFNLENKRVFICIDSKSIGDTLAWMPYIEKFSNEHKCKVICSTFHNSILKRSYNTIQFVEPGEEVYNIYAQYILGVFFGNEHIMHPKNPRSIPLQQIASDILGLQYTELNPKIDIDNLFVNDIEPYVCIGTESTAQCKLWNNTTGWQEVVDYLTNNGLKVISIRKNGTSGLNNVIELVDKALPEVIACINQSNFFIGLGSGLSWIAHSLNKPVVLISGFSEKWCEFSTPYRVINESVCHGCFNDEKETFDRGKWDWCPRNKGFECTSEISSTMVIDQVKKLI